MRKGDTINVSTSVEISGPGDSYRELVLEFEMVCTLEAYRGHFDHISGSAEPPSGPEFETVAVSWGDSQTDDEPKLLDVVSGGLLEALLGPEIWSAVVEDVYQKAADHQFVD